MKCHTVCRAAVQISIILEIGSSKYPINTECSENLAFVTVYVNAR